MRIDLHVHTRLSRDNDCDPDALFRRAKQIGLDALCITEHHSYEVSAAHEPVAARHGIRLFRACEASTAWGHLLLFGVRDDSWNRYRGVDLDALDVIRAARAQGAFVVAAHPFRRGSNRRFLGDRVRTLDVDGIEVLNGGANDDENAMARSVAVERGLAMTGGSDAHRPEDLGRAYTEIDGDVRTMDDLVAALRERRTQPSQPSQPR
jgi:hypothetical protein